MALSSASVSAAELAARGRDAPVIVGSNVVRDATVAEWWEGTTQTDVTESGYGPELAYDDLADYQTRPELGSSASYSLYFKVPANGVIDCLAIFGHNCHLLNGNRIDVYGEIADSKAAFAGAVPAASGTTIIYEDEHTDDAKRIFAVSLPTSGGDLRYTDGRHIRISFVSDSTLTVVPRVGEIVLGRQRQLAMKSLPGAHDDGELSVDAVVSDSRTGARTTVIHHYGRAKLRGDWRVRPDQLSLDTVTQAREAISEAQNGAGSFLYCPDPTSDVRRVWLMKRGQERLDNYLPIERNTRRRFTLEAEELPPFYAVENS